MPRKAAPTAAPIGRKGRFKQPRVWEEGNVCVSARPLSSGSALTATRTPAPGAEAAVAACLQNTERCAGVLAVQVKGVSDGFRFGSGSLAFP